MSLPPIFLRFSTFFKAVETPPNARSEWYLSHFCVQHSSRLSVLLPSPPDFFFFFMLALPPIPHNFPYLEKPIFISAPLETRKGECCLRLMFLVFQSSRLSSFRLSFPRDPSNGPGPAASMSGWSRRFLFFATPPSFPHVQEERPVRGDF